MRPREWGVFWGRFNFSLWGMKLHKKGNIRGVAVLLVEVVLRNFLDWMLEKFRNLTTAKYFMRFAVAELDVG